MSSPAANFKKILLVEDEPALREFYARLLKDNGYAVESVEDGEKAFEHIKSEAFDLVLLDMVLPVMSGLDVLRKMKSLKTASVASSTIILTNIDDA